MNRFFTLNVVMYSKTTMTNKVEKILDTTRISALLITVSYVAFSCTIAQERTDQKEELPLPPFDTTLFLTLEQEAAFDALNEIQIQGTQLYSTFSGIHHECFPPDTSFVISQAELLIVIEDLLIQNYPNIPPKEQSKLANQAVLAQEEYLVIQCNGSWILPEVLNQRDIIIER